MFRAILTAQRWEGSLQAFKHFLVERVRFNSDPDQGHGALCRHSHPMTAYASMGQFKQMLIQAVPQFADLRQAQPGSR